MRYILTAILIISFIGIAIFGFTLFAMGSNHMNSGCVTSPIDGAPCPADIVAMTLQHISSLQTFTTSTAPSAFNLLALLSFILIALVSVFLLYKNLLNPRLGFLHQRLRDLKFNFLYSRQKISSWLSLFENSPAF